MRLVCALLQSGGHRPVSAGSGPPHLQGGPGGYRRRARAAVGAEGRRGNGGVAAVGVPADTRGCWNCV